MDPYIQGSVCCSIVFLASTAAGSSDVNFNGRCTVYGGGYASGRSSFFLRMRHFTYNMLAVTSARIAPAVTAPTMVGTTTELEAPCSGGLGESVAPFCGAVAETAELLLADVLGVSSNLTYTELGHLVALLVPARLTCKWHNRRGKGSQKLPLQPKCAARWQGFPSLEQGPHIHRWWNYLGSAGRCLRWHCRV